MTDPRAWLAAYADGGLSPEEAAEVERWLADRPEARREVDDLRALIAEVRAAAPAPREEPAWHAMRRAIVAAVEADAAPWWRRAVAAVRAYRAVAAASAAGALALAFAAVVAHRPAAREESATAKAMASAAAAGDWLPSPDDLPGLAEAWEADSIVFDLDPDEGFEGLVDSGDGAGDAAGDVWSDALSAAGADDDALDFSRPPPEAELYELSDDEIEAIYAYLKGVSPS
ncbi:MAG: hypothetical protein D6689_11915 [Deltaproteobacteria bacterium]|nr:MAG: hypothetical protein D6689_11915 [Deltaproteobacteria bacterium]